MANSVVATVLQDGSRNVRVRITGILDTSDLAYTVLINPATLNYMDVNNKVRASQLRIDKIDYDVEDALELRMFWDATTPVLIDDFTGRGVIDNTKYQDWNNSKAAGYTGAIGFSTQGWTASQILSFTVTLTLVKQ